MNRERVVSEAQLRPGMMVEVIDCRLCLRGRCQMLLVSEGSGGPHTHELPFGVRECTDVTWDYVGCDMRGPTCFAASIRQARLFIVDPLEGQSLDAEFEKELTL